MFYLEFYLAMDIQQLGDRHFIAQTSRKFLKLAQILGNQHFMVQTSHQSAFVPGNLYAFSPWLF